MGRWDGWVGEELQTIITLSAQDTDRKTVRVPYRIINFH